MRLFNRFKNEDKMRVWLDHPYCALTDSNQNCSLHHIYGCKLPCHSSIYNAIMLCDSEHRKADGMNGSSVEHEDYRQELLSIAIFMVNKSNHKKTKVDEDFLNKYANK